MAFVKVDRNVSGTVAAWGALLESTLPEWATPIDTARTVLVLDNAGDSTLAITATPGGSIAVTNRAGSAFTIPNNRQSLTGCLVFPIK